MDITLGQHYKNIFKGVTNANQCGYKHGQNVTDLYPKSFIGLGICFSSCFKLYKLPIRIRIQKGARIFNYFISDQGVHSQNVLLSFKNSFKLRAKLT